MVNLERHLARTATVTSICTATATGSMGSPMNFVWDDGQGPVNGNSPFITLTRGSRAGGGGNRREPAAPSDPILVLTRSRTGQRLQLAHQAGGGRYRGGRRRG